MLIIQITVIFILVILPGESWTEAKGDSDSLSLRSQPLKNLEVDPNLVALQSATTIETSVLAENMLSSKACSARSAVRTI